MSPTNGGLLLYYNVCFFLMLPSFENTKTKVLWFIDILFWLRYSFGRSYRISSQHRPREIGYTYGETSTKAFLKIMSRIEDTKGKRFLELGSGTGRLCLIASSVLGMSATGIEKIAPFVSFGQRMIRLLQMNNCTLNQGDIFEHSWAEADVLYLTATTFPEHVMERVYTKCHELKVGSIFVCVTQKVEREDMELVDMEVLSFRWGVATVFFYKKL